MAIGNPPLSPSVRLLSNSNIGVAALSGRVEYVSKLATLDRRSGRLIDTKKVDGFAYEIQTVRIAGGDRVAVLSTTHTEQADLTLYDVDRDGQISLRAHATLPGAGLVGHIVLSGRTGAGFVLVNNPPVFEVVAFSLDNGQLLSRTTVSTTPTPLVLLEGATTQIVLAEFIPASLGFRFLDVTEPTRPIDSGLVEFALPPPTYPGLVMSATATPDGRYLFFSDAGFGLSILDSVQRRVVGFVATSVGLGHLQVDESSGRRLVSVLRVDASGYSAHLIVLVDATDPSHPTVVGQRATDDSKADLQFSPDGTQLVALGETGLAAYDVDLLTDSWNTSLKDDRRLAPSALATLANESEVFGVWQDHERGAFTLCTLTVPSVKSVTTSGRDILVRGDGFDGVCVVEIDGIAVVTRRLTARTDTLRVKHGLDGIAPGTVVTITVRNGVGARSSRVEFGAVVSAEQ